MCTFSLQTDLSDDRLRRLLERLDQQGYIVAYEIRGMLYRYEVEHGLLPASTSLWQKVRPPDIIQLDISSYKILQSCALQIHGMQAFLP